MTGDQAHDALEDGRRSPAKARTRALLTPGAHPELEAEERRRKVHAYTAALEVANWEFEVEGHRVELLIRESKRTGNHGPAVQEQIRQAQARKSAAMQLIKALRKALRGESV